MLTLAEYKFPAIFFRRIKKKSSTIFFIRPHFRFMENNLISTFEWAMSFSSTTSEVAERLFLFRLRIDFPNLIKNVKHFR